jgi:dipeptidyl aminopeptidase/acylaminoacyl peptidase
MKPDGTGVTRITFPTGGNGDPAYSPDGSKIAFKSPSRSNYEISVMNADGTGRTQLTSTSVVESEPTWSPDGQKIAFVASSSDVDGQTDPEIWTMNANGTGRTQLTNNTFPDTQPAWSPDGAKIAFVSARTGDTNRNVYVMNADGTGQTSITPNSPPGCSSNCYQGHDDDPTWSPDGSKIAYVHGYGPPDNPFAGGGLPNIWTMDPTGANKTNVSNNPDVSSVHPAWSPDGTRIAYVGATDTNRDIYAMNADGTGQGVLHTNAANDVKPDWQQDSIPPQTTTTSGPSGATNSTSASFSFVSSETGSTFECSLDGAAFTACPSPTSYSGLPNGSHTLSVRATDVAGNVDSTPARRAWTVDIAKPTIANMRPVPGSITRDTTPVISATVRDNMTNLSKRNITLYVEGKKIAARKFSYSAATDRLIYRSPKLSKGKKTVRIVARDAAGNVGARSWYFTVR